MQTNLCAFLVNSHWRTHQYVFWELICACCYRRGSRVLFASSVISLSASLTLFASIKLQAAEVAGTSLLHSSIRSVSDEGQPLFKTNHSFDPQTSNHAFAESNNDTRYERVWTRSINIAHEPPVVDGDEVFVFSREGVLSALDMKSGAIIWECPLLSYALTPFRDAAPIPIQGLDNPSPAVAGEVVLVPFSRQFDGFLYAIDRRKGTVRWRYQVPRLPRRKHSTIITAPVVSGDTVVFRTSNGLTALRLSDGSVRWSTPTGDEYSLMMRVMSSPAIDVKEGNVFLNPDNGMAYAFRLADGRPRWQFRADSNQIKSVGVIQENRTTLHRCTPLFLTDSQRVIVADGEGVVTALDARSGSPIWKKRLGLAWQLQQSRGRIYVATSSGFIEVDPQQGKVLRTLPLSGGAFSFVINPVYAVIATNPRTLPGWQLLNLETWRVLAQASDLRIRQGIAVSDDIILASGTDAVEEISTDTKVPLGSPALPVVATPTAPAPAKPAFVLCAYRAINKADSANPPLPSKH